MSETSANKIRSQISSTKRKRYENRSKSYDLGMELLFNTKEELEDVQHTYGIEDQRYKTLSDDLAIGLLQCGIDHFLTMKDKTSFSESSTLEILNSAKVLTENGQILHRIEENIEGIRDWVKTQNVRYSEHRKYEFNYILLNTAFSFMTCDGHIDENEINYIKKKAKDERLFGSIDIEKELDIMIVGINTLGMMYLKDYFKILKNVMLTHTQEMQLIDIAVNMLYADDKVSYHEIKFFKIFRSMLSLTDAQIKDNWPDLPDEFFERDIFSHVYLGKLFDNYFDDVVIPLFDTLHSS